MTNELLGMLTVLVTTNFAGVSFAPVPCLHPGCTEGHHSFTATERYMIVRETWAEVVDAAGQGTGENRRISSDTNDWGSLSHPIAHPSVYRMHTQPGWAVRPGTRWPLDLPPLPPWEASGRAIAPRRSNAASLPSDTNQYGVLYNVTSNYPMHKLVLEKRATDRSSGVQVWSDGVNRYTNPPASYTADFLLSLRTNAPSPSVTLPPQRFKAVPATNALPRSRRFTQ